LLLRLRNVNSASLYQHSTIGHEHQAAEFAYLTAT